ncbi:MAG: hypothetical protein PHH06_00895 [Candidatus Gracilibacteria bacterium]|nr:hypothetical protein [Candidatus Gracilibacteria bacterium]
MQIQDRDDRGLTDVNPISFRTGDVIFHEMRITGSYAKAIIEMLKGNLYFVGEETIKVSFDEQREVFDMGGNSMVVEYKDKQNRDNDIELLKKHFKSKGKFAEELENGRQIPEFDGYFDYDNRYYIVIDGLNRLTDEINPEKGIYKGVIVNPSKYFAVQNQVSDTGGEVEDILGGDKQNS